MKTLVYIASTGYSGSTLLESILGSNARCLNLGEIYKLPYWPICSCGEKVDDCGFWKELDSQLQQRPGAAGRRLRDWHVQGRRAKSGLQKHIHNAFIALGGPGSLELFCALSREVRDFRDGCARALDLFDTAATMAGASVVIDSSKDPVYLRHLHALAPERLRVIHLVRDPRAVAHSFVKNFDRDGITYASEASGRRPSYAEGAAFWTARNRNIGLALQRLPAAHQLLLRYEDLCLQPDAAAEQLSRFIGEDIAIPEIIHLRQQHTIAGNPMRQSETSVRVGLVEDWCARIPAGEAPHIRAAAGRLAGRYGYEI